MKGRVDGDMVAITGNYRASARPGRSFSSPSPPGTAPGGERESEEGTPRLGLITPKMEVSPDAESTMDSLARFDTNVNPT
jgi:hypothetical protein